MEADVMFEAAEYGKIKELLTAAEALRDHLNRLTTLSRPLLRYDIEHEAVRAFSAALEQALQAEAKEAARVSDRQGTKPTAKRRR